MSSPKYSMWRIMRKIQSNVSKLFLLQNPLPISIAIKPIKNYEITAIITLNLNSNNAPWYALMNGAVIKGLSKVTRCVILMCTSISRHSEKLILTVHQSAQCGRRNEKNPTSKKPCYLLWGYLGWSFPKLSEYLLQSSCSIITPNSISNKWRSY